jgi:MraZ protein
MYAMLLGTWIQTVDEQGRMLLPSSFHEDLGAMFVATRGFDRCLQVFPSSAWDTLAQRVSSLPLAGSQARQLRRLLFSAAMSLDLGGDGAIVLPQPLLRYADIRQRAVLVGVHTHFEIWSYERWQAEDDQLLHNAGHWPQLDLSLAAA